MQAWFKEHPGGQFTITPPLLMPRRKANIELDGLSRDEAAHHFKQTLAGSKWKVIRGFHVLRHSFGAICTRAGIPMNVIAKWMGHTTDEMMKLYQHLFPQDEQKWMEKFPV
jgi:integrase